MALFQKLFKVYPGEGRKLLLFTALAILLQVGVAVGLSIADSIFLSRLGAENLPIVYVIAPAVMVLFVPLMSFGTGRFGVDRVFDAIQYVLIAGGVFFFLAIGGSVPAFQGEWVLYLLRLYAYLWLVLLYTLFWNLVDGYFDILDAKRLYPIFGGGLSIGSALGGGMVSLLSGQVGSQWIFLIWPVVAALSIMVAQLLRKSVRKIEDDVEVTPGSFIEQSSRVLKTAGRSSYVLFINVVMFGTLILTTFTEFQYLDIFATGRGEAELATLFGYLFLAVNGVNIVINFFLFNRIIVWIGVKNALLVQPVVYLIAFALFFLYGGMEAALFGFIAYHGFYISFDANNWNFLFNAVPSEVKKEIRTFTEGLMDPFATAIAGLILLLAGFSAGLSEWFTLDNLAAGGLVLAFVHLGVAFLLRHHYPLAIMENLRKDWLNFSLSRKDLSARITDPDLQRFQLESLQVESPAHLSSIRFLGLRRRAAALESLVLAFSEPGKDEDSRAELLAEILEEEDSFVVQRVIQWAEQEQASFPASVLRELGSHGLIPSRKAMPLLVSEKAQEREAAVVALWNSRDLQDNFMALDELRSLLDGSEEEKASAIAAFGFTRKESYAHSLVGYLDDPSPVMRSRALESIRMLVGPASSRLIPTILRAMEHAGEQDRFRGIDILERIQDAESLFPLFKMAEDFNPRQRRRVEMFSRSLGLKSVPAIVAVLGNETLPYRSRSLAARTLAHLSFAQLESMVPAIVETEIRSSYLYLDRALVLRDSSSSSESLQLLSQYYQDMQQTTLEFVLEILALAGRIPDYEQIAASLRSSNPRGKGDSIETLEQSIHRSVFRNLLPLVDSRPLEEKIAFYHANFPSSNDADVAILEKALKTRNDLEKALASQALYELRGESSLDRIYRAEPFTGPIARAVYLSLSNPEREGLNPVERLRALKADPLLNGLSVLNLRIPALAAENRTAENSTLYREGDIATALYIPVEGTVEAKGSSVFRRDTGYEVLERLGSNSDNRGSAAQDRDDSPVKEAKGSAGRGFHRSTVTMVSGRYLVVSSDAIEEMFQSDPQAALAILEAMSP